ncbi:MAG: NAD(P)(+) transhydrogenase (Re/Si-specific) subunit beta [Anaerovoracaceae bacterium]|nr:NAD(P)(+) transhydrogenase (Re/Si-specific) subunit beta [Clostridiales bacterium]
MSDILYYVLCGLLALGVLIGLSMLSKVKTAVRGNTISVLCTLGAIVITLIKYDIITKAGLIISVLLGIIAGLVWAFKVKIISMPQVVALLNGFGGGAAALVGVVTLLDKAPLDTFSLVTAGLAVMVGTLTLTGSLVAAGKLHKILPQKPVIWKGHQAITTTALILSVVSVILIATDSLPISLAVLAALLVSGFFGVAFTIRVGGADMPITISLLVSLSGVADGIAGMAISNILLVSLGGIVGASGLLLTRVMCKAMNRSLNDILMGKTSVSGKASVKAEPEALPMDEPAFEMKEATDEGKKEILMNAKKVIIIPGYGMALAQAQEKVRILADKLEENGATVDYAIHPVAGRMPGHMNVLLAEVDVSYEKLRSMEDVNEEFSEADLAIVIGANDVINPAANTAEGTPIYGMPVLNVAKAKNIIILNYDDKPGYAGVDNPLYRNPDVILLFGNAEETVQSLIDLMN